MSPRRNSLPRASSGFWAAEDGAALGAAASAVNARAEWLQAESTGWPVITGNFSDFDAENRGIVADHCEAAEKSGS
jgi:hypothetical protein